MNPIALDGLTVRYGHRLALDQVSLEVPEGSVYALLGRNGAGKSSLVRCLLGEQKPAAGRALLLGRDVWRERAAILAEVGVVPEDPNAPPAMTARQLSRFCSRLYPRWDAAGVEARLKRFGVPSGTPFGKLSKGQKGQVSLALALASSPRLLVLDDPTLGLDAVARKAVFEELIGELADRGTTVFITTHDLAGVERIADRVGDPAAGAARARRGDGDAQAPVPPAQLPALAGGGGGAARGAGAGGRGLPRLGGRGGGLELRRGAPAASRTSPEVTVAHPGGDLHRPDRRLRRREPMRGFVAVFEREIVERRLLLVAPWSWGSCPWLLPLDCRGFLRAGSRRRLRERHGARARSGPHRRSSRSSWAAR